ncbi:MAG TPA: heme-binding protein [Candidatus Binatia bacterium]|jgi:uncharacterized protein GlcG (DUF336 family)|nr:heme-binding protein [Candidatus Binatia bacterium]
MMNYVRYTLLGAVFVISLATAIPAGAQSCAGLPSNPDLRALLNNAATGVGVGPVLVGPGGGPGGLFAGTRMWAAVVDRNGAICSFETSTIDQSQVWPGSQAIAKAKAFTANAFSLEVLSLSTARLYTFAQPSHSLFGLNDSNPFKANSPATGIQGGIITFGGGVPLYNADGKIIGGLGVSGDTACTDHEIAKRVRDLAGLNPVGGPLVDDIVYSSVDPPSLHVFTHPLCPNTIRNGVFIGNEQPAVGY